MVTAVSVLLAFGLAAPAPDSTPKWRWWSSCPQPRVTRLTITLRGKPLYRGTLRVCHVPDAAYDPGDKQELAVFYFRADAAMFGDEFRELGTRVIEGNVWEAGGDPDDVIFGVSFAAANQGLLNTLHIASASQVSRFEIAPGLTSETSAFHGPESKPEAPLPRRRTTR